MNDQRGFGGGSPSLSQEMFDAIMRGEVPQVGAPGGGPFAFGQPTMPMGNASQPPAFNSMQPSGPPGMARQGPLGDPKKQKKRNGFVAPEIVPGLGGWGQWVNPQMGFGQIGGGPGYAPQSYGYEAGDMRMNGGAGGWDARAGYGNPYAGSER